ncbi:MAG TPA: hypothetical protein VGM44_15070 [Polyangiaceae bacterium]|jgi:tetratricopeptide (TPR) repeat protein
MKRLLRGTLAAAVFAACSMLLVQRVRHQRQVAQNQTLLAPLFAALEAAKQPKTASRAVRSICARPDTCTCIEAATRAALDADLYGLASHLLDAAPRTCPNQTMLLGERAEAEARAGAHSAEQTAQLALSQSPANGYAELALARVQYDANQMHACADHAANALKFGRGAEADRLLGRTALALSQFADAESHFRNVLKVNPNDLEAAFSAAYCDDKLGRYRDAREGFLQTLRIDPKHKLARVDLILLTANAGAKDEARHHLKKLLEIVPPDSAEAREMTQFVANSADGTSGSSGAGGSATLERSNGRFTLQGTR